MALVKTRAVVFSCHNIDYPRPIEREALYNGIRLNSHGQVAS